MAGEIHSLEIFAAGTHNAKSGKVTVTIGDLDQIVEAFEALNGTNIVKPHLKLGHTDAQAWFGQQDGIPALGWISNVWREGKKLLANVSQVPDALLDLIRSERFHNVSSEVFWDAPIEHEGKRFPRVLSAVAILGVEMPAVKDLAGLASALFQTAPIHAFSASDGESVTIETETRKKENVMPGDTKPMGFTQEQVDALTESAVEKAVKTTKAEFAEAIASKDKELKVATDRAEEAEAELKKVRVTAAASEAEHIVDAAIKDGKLQKKQKEFAVAMLTASTTKVKFGEGEKTMTELFKDFLEASGKVIETGEKGGHEPAPEGATASQKVDTAVKALMSEDSKLNYSQAFDRVIANDPELAAEYSANQS